MRSAFGPSPEATPMSSGRIPTATGRAVNRRRPGRVRTTSLGSAMIWDPTVSVATSSATSFEEVHGRRTDESRDEHIGRTVIEHLRRIALLEYSRTQYRDAMTQRHRFGLVVRDVQRGHADALAGLSRLRRASAPAIWRRGSRAAHPSRTPLARGRWRDPSPPVDAVHPRAGWACGPTSRRSPRTLAAPLPAR